MSEHKYPSQLAERFQIRLPEGMRNRIREEAEKNNRSMNAEILHRLAQSFDQGAETRAYFEGYLDANKRGLSRVSSQLKQIIEEIEAFAGSDAEQEPEQSPPVEPGEPGVSLIRKKRALDL